MRLAAHLEVRQASRTVRLHISHGERDSWRQRQTAKSIRLPAGTRPVFVWHEIQAEWSTMDGYSTVDNPMINAEPLEALDAALAALATCPATVQPVRIYNENGLEINRANVAAMEFPSLTDLAREPEPEPPSEAQALEVALRQEMATMTERIDQLQAQVSTLMATSKANSKRRIDDDD